MVKELREKTGAGMMECKTALVETQGDFQKAVDFLRERGLAKAAKKANRAADEGTIATYIHAGGKLGVMVEVNTETDFVAKTDEFQNLAKEIAMHIAAANPQYVSREQVPSEVLEKEREILRAQLGETKKPADIIEKILNGKIEKYYEEVCLLDQPFVKIPEKKISQLLAEAVAKVGENIQISRFVRMKIGEA
jgi:elongation factor Ts